jgi:toxin ParE1/3/4
VSRPLLTEPEADQELEDAAWWYEEQRPGLGQLFLKAVEATVDSIQQFPGAGAPVPFVASDLPVRRAPVQRFPYHVVYLETAMEIRVLAVAHDRRRPGYWLQW